MRILSVFGTRPEAIKMAPLVQLLSRQRKVDSRVCVTGQHREMLDQVLGLFDIRPQYDLNVMKPRQTLLGTSSELLRGLESVLDQFRPDMVLVHGDTSTTLFATIAAFYSKVPVGHVEAGLRTGNLKSPWPEEAHRRLTTTLADLHFAPTSECRTNLLGEGVPDAAIHVTGNTVIDALLATKEMLRKNAGSEGLFSMIPVLRKGARLILITGHRRENFGAGFQRICTAIRSLARTFPDADFLYPVHLNPRVREPAQRTLDGIDNVHLVPPMSYQLFVQTMIEAHIVLTDSGGIQEEAPSLGKPVLVMRDTTERPEAVAAGTVRLVGTDPDAICAGVTSLMNNEEEYARMARAHNPYGDGHASERIVAAILGSPASALGDAAAV